MIELPYMKLTLPDNWNCTTEKTETSCVSTQGHESKQTVVLINAKETTPAETMESFYQQLAKPKGVGTVKKVEYVQIGDTKWIQAHHSNSDLANYDTVYWMTRVQNIAILVTYSFLAKNASSLYPLAQSLPQSFQLNKAEIDRLSKVTQMAKAEGQPVVSTETPAPIAPEAKESLATKASKLIKSGYMIPLIVLCVILILVALFLR